MTPSVTHCTAALTAAGSKNKSFSPFHRLDFPSPVLDKTHGCSTMPLSLNTDPKIERGSKNL